MLAWLTKSGGIPVVPVCLEGWQPRPGFAVVHKEQSDGTHVVGIGDPLIFPVPRTSADLGSGWQVAQNTTDFDPLGTERQITWADTTYVRDLKGRNWLVPVIQTAEGLRAFRVAYGAAWLPLLTAEQTRAEEICTAARSAFVSGAPMAVACQWAAELLCLTHHLTPEVVAALGLLDDVLVVGVLQAACSRELGKETAHGV